MALSGMRAFITGGRKGIGRGVALTLADSGCSAVRVADVIDDVVTQQVGEKCMKDKAVSMSTSLMLVYRTDALL